MLALFRSGAAGSDHIDKIIGLGETSKKTILIIAKQTRLGSYRLNLEMLPGSRKKCGQSFAASGRTSRRKTSFRHLLILLGFNDKIS